MSATPTTSRPGCARSDDVLLLQIAVRNDAALAELYDRYGRLAYGLALRVLRDRALAEDAVQEAFLTVWRHADRFRSERGTARTWVLALVHRRAVDLVRLEGRRTAARLPHADHVALESAEEAVALRIERRRAQGALDRLAHPLRQVLELAYYGGLTQAEIAARLDIPLGTVKSRASTALEHLRHLLADEAGAPDGSSANWPGRRREAVERVAAGA